MADHLLVETHGPWNGRGCERFVGDAVALARHGHAVWLFLVEDGVAAALCGALPALAQLARCGGTIWADEFSLHQRGLTELVVEAEPVTIDAVAAKLLEPHVRVVWH